MFLLAMADGPSGGGSSDDEPSNTVVAYLATSQSLLAAAVAGSGQTWKNLKKAFKESFDDNNYPVISAAENEMLAVTGIYKSSGGFDKGLTWKPQLLGTDGVNGLIMIASKENSNQTYLIYYNGNYYFHTNGTGVKDASWVSDKGAFDTTLLTDPPASGSRWVKVE